MKKRNIGIRSKYTMLTIGLVLCHYCSFFSCVCVCYAYRWNIIVFLYIELELRFRSGEIYTHYHIIRFFCLITVLLVSTVSQFTIVLSKKKIRSRLVHCVARLPRNMLVVSASPITSSCRFLKQETWSCYLVLIGNSSGLEHDFTIELK